MNSIIILSVSILTAIAVWFGYKPHKFPIPTTSKPVSHQLWNELLQKYVSKDGKVNYKGIKNDSLKFNTYLELLSSSHPNDNWSKSEQMTYWINAYNAFTVELILKHYPVKSIRDIGGLVKIPGIQSAWDIKFIKIENQEYTLGNIEHDILRKKFSEPRIHFAINCASYSCPKLKNEAYTADKLEQQLTESAKEFINDTFQNKIAPNKIEVSKIFDWNKSDFTKSGTIISYINKYSAVKIKSDASVSYMEYNWDLNE